MHAALFGILAVIGLTGLLVSAVLFTIAHHVPPGQPLTTGGARRLVEEDLTVKPPAATSRKRKHGKAGNRRDAVAATPLTDEERSFVLDVPENLIEEYQRLSVRAGTPHELSARQLAFNERYNLWVVSFLVIVVCALGPAFLRLILWAGGHVAGWEQFDARRLYGSVLAFAVFVLAFGLFTMVRPMRLDLAARAAKRAMRAREELPFAVDSLVLVLDAGGDFQSALEAYVEYGPEGGKLLLREEFDLMLQEIRAGSTRDEALHRLAQRINCIEMDRLVIAIVEGDRSGTPLAARLRSQSEYLRLERSTRATEIAERMSREMAVPAMLMFIAMALLLVGPSLIPMYRNLGNIIP